MSGLVHPSKFNNLDIMPENSSRVMRLERTVFPGVETLLSIQMLPKSVCPLYHLEVPDQRFQVDADDHGIVHFRARAPQRRGSAYTESDL